MSTLTAPIDRTHDEAMQFRQWLDVEIERAKRTLGVDTWDIAPMPEGWRR